MRGVREAEDVGHDGMETVNFIPIPAIGWGRKQLKAPICKGFRIMVSTKRLTYREIYRRADAENGTNRASIQGCRDGRIPDGIIRSGGRFQF